MGIDWYDPVAIAIKQKIFDYAKAKYPERPEEDLIGQIESAEVFVRLTREAIADMLYGEIDILAMYSALGDTVPVEYIAGLGTGAEIVVGEYFSDRK
jgi:hypothetical protein